MIDLKIAQQFTDRLAIKLGKHILNSRNRIKIVEQKDLVDICTNIDKEVEQMAIDAINKSYPDHNIHSEECGFIDKQSEYTWYIDPIDGTKEYIRGLPIFQTIITLENDSDIMVGVVYQPIWTDLFSASINETSKLNGALNKVSSQNKLSKSIVYYHPPNSKFPVDIFWKDTKTLGNLSLASYRLRGDSNDVIDLGWVASGSIEGYISLHTNLMIKWHDVSAGLLFAQQAGGKVTDMFGNPIQNRDLSNGLIASNGHIHDQLLEIIQKSL